MADIKKQLGQRVKYLRKNHDLSQEQLSEMLGITARSLGNIENGRCFMSLSGIEKLIDIFDIEPYELFVFDKTPPKDIVYEDVAKKLEKHKKNSKNLYVISAFLDNI